MNYFKAGMLNFMTYGLNVALRIVMKGLQDKKKEKKKVLYVLQPSCHYLINKINFTFRYLIPDSFITNHNKRPQYNIEQCDCVYTLSAHGKKSEAQD